MVLLLSCQEVLFIPVSWDLSWQDGADLVCVFFGRQAGEGVRHSIVGQLHTQSPLSSEPGKTVDVVAGQSPWFSRAVGSGSGTDYPSSTGIFCLPRNV